jgi:hypothetical protein
LIGIRLYTLTMIRIMNSTQHEIGIGFSTTIEITLKELEILKSIVMLTKVKCDRLTAEPDLLKKSTDIRILAEKLHRLGLKNIEIK